MSEHPRFRERIVAFVLQLGNVSITLSRLASLTSILGTNFYLLLLLHLPSLLDGRVRSSAQPGDPSFRNILTPMIVEWKMFRAASAFVFV
jgi:hypothetical protein